MSNAVIAPAKEYNKLRIEDRAAHDWYRFVLSYPAHLVQDYLARFGVDSTQTVLDPFCGTGTTLVECKKLGIPSIGIESNPMASLASRVKVDWEVDPKGFLAHAEEVANRSWQKLEKEGITHSSHLPLFKKNGAAVVHLRSLPEEKLKLLLKDSISPLPLHKTLTLIETLHELENSRFSATEHRSFLGCRRVYNPSTSSAN
jgi:DNA methylase